MKAIILFLFILSVVGFADINISHPRIYLNSEIIQKLQLNIGNSEFQSLQSWCDSRLYSATGDYLDCGYEGWDWYTAAMNYALMYQCTNDTIYGNEALVYLVAMLRDACYPSGSLPPRAHIGITDPGYSGTGGSATTYEPIISMDAGYGARTVGVGIAMARDWLGGLPRLSSTLIEEITTEMDTSIQWILDTNPWASDIPEDNYYAGYFNFIYAAAIAFSGDTGYNNSWWSTAVDMWENDVQPLIEGHFDGGAHLEGWNYGPLASRGYIGFPIACQTGTDTSLWASTNWHSDLVKGHMYMLYPSRDKFWDNGKWSGNTKGDPRSALMKFVASYAPISDTYKGYAKWYVDNIDASEVNANWIDYLFNLDNSAVIPNADTLGGLIYTNSSGEVIIHSNDWSDITASVVTMVANPYNAGDKSGVNGGEITIFTNGEELLVSGNKAYNSYPDRGLLQSVALIDGLHGYAPSQEAFIGDRTVDGYSAPSIKTIGVNRTYAYAEAENLNDLYNGDQWSTYDSDAQYYSRSMVYCEPNFIVVYDNLYLSSGATDCYFRWYFRGQPIVSGTGGYYTGSNSRLFFDVKGLDGSFGTPFASSTIVAYSYWDGTYGTDFNPTGFPANNQSFTIFEIADTTQSTINTVNYLTPTGVKGLHIPGTSLDWVALFTASTSGADVSGNISFSFSPTADTTNCILADLPTGTSYSISSSGTTTKTVSLNTSGTDYSVSDEGTVAFAVLKDNSIVEVVFPNGYDMPDVPPEIPFNLRIKR